VHPVNILHRKLIVAWKSYNSDSGEWSATYKKNIELADHKELVEALGFDPDKVTAEVIAEAYEITGYLFDDGAIIFYNVGFRIKADGGRIQNGRQRHALNEPGHKTKEVILEISRAVERGQAIYSKPILTVYDLWVLGFSNKFIWKCPTYNILNNFNEHVSSNHLDIGVGTGYFLDKCQFGTGNVNIALMDLNQNSLDEAAKRIERYNPVKYKVNVLEKINIDTDRFDSISLNYLFHCLPGNLTEKLIVLDNVDHLLNESGVIFGSTILTSGVNTSRSAKALMRIYNKKGIFDNSTDSLDDLKKYLTKKYSSFSITTHGCVAIFSAIK